MPPELRSEQLVYDLEAWYRSHSVRQKDLAGSLNMTAQQLAEILSAKPPDWRAGFANPRIFTNEYETSTCRPAAYAANYQPRRSRRTAGIS
jgi:hypothetical protein